MRDLPRAVYVHSYDPWSFRSARAKSSRVFIPPPPRFEPQRANSLYNFLIRRVWPEQISRVEQVSAMSFEFFNGARMESFASSPCGTRIIVAGSSRGFVYRRLDGALRVPSSRGNICHRSRGCCKIRPRKNCANAIYPSLFLFPPP